MSSVSETHGVRCPVCEFDDRIDVAALVWTRLTPDGAALDESADGTQEWDSESATICHSCGVVGTMESFRVKT
jgi:hypothetical protein